MDPARDALRATIQGTRAIARAATQVGPATRAIVARTLAAIVEGTPERIAAGT
jgi:hypothetical protein